MSEREQDNLEPQEQGQDVADDELREEQLREEQEGKGFGEDEGERDESLPA
jgi:hypothetical protein